VGHTRYAVASIAVDLHSWTSSLAQCHRARPLPRRVDNCSLHLGWRPVHQRAQGMSSDMSLSRMRSLTLAVESRSRDPRHPPRPSLLRRLALCAAHLQARHEAQHRYRLDPLGARLFVCPSTRTRLRPAHVRSRLLVLGWVNIPLGLYRAAGNFKASRTVDIVYFVWFGLRVPSPHYPCKLECSSCGAVS
jgi:hypothetical protein